MTKPVPASEGVDALDEFVPNNIPTNISRRDEAMRKRLGIIPQPPTRLARLIGQARRRSKAPITLPPVKLDGAQ